MVIERGQFVAWVRADSLEADIEAASAATKDKAPIRFGAPRRLRSIGRPASCAIAN
jgi:hypothetical protein